MAEVVLLFPPECREVNEPCINTTELAAYLRKNNISVRQYDANIEFQNYIYTVSGFKELCEFSTSLCNEFNCQPEEFSWLSTADRDTVFMLLQKACNGIKTEDGYYNFEHFFKYKNIHHRFMTAIQAMIRQIMKKNKCQTLHDIDVLISHGTPYDLYFRNTLVPELLCESPLIVDIFVMSHGQLVPALLLGKILKAYGCHVVLSDILPTHLRDDIMNNPDFFCYVDGIIIYEQERSILSLLQQIKSNKQFCNVPNYIFCNSGKIVNTPISAPISLDNIPVPDFSDFNYTNYLSAACVLPYSTSRGCAWGKCMFCHLHKGASQYSEKSVHKVAMDLCDMKAKYHSDIVLFYDNVILPDRLLSIAQSLLEEKVNVMWSAITKPIRMILPGEAELLYQAGCRHLEFEVESINPEMHLTMQTGIDLDILWDTLQNTRHAGIINSVCLLYGCYNEKIADFLITNQAILEHKEIVNAVIPFQMYLAKDSELYTNREKYSLHLKEPLSDLWDTYLNFSGEKWADIYERDAGVADLVKKTTSVFPNFKCSYLSIINYICHYSCNDPIQLVNLSDHTVLNSDVVPMMHSYIVKLKHTDSSDDHTLYNLVNGKSLHCNDVLQKILPFVDGKTSALNVIYKLADREDINRGVAILKYLPVLNQYRNFIN